MIHDLDTMPMPVVWHNRAVLPTIRQIREQCHLTHAQIAKAANVRLCTVFWMEEGVAVYRSEALSILSVLSYWSGRRYSLTDVRGIRLKAGLKRSGSHYEEII